MLRKRRTWPASSRRGGFSSGNFSSRTENSSPRFVAAQEREAVPAVWRRRAGGFCTVMVIFLLSLILPAGPLSRDGFQRSKASRAIARPDGQERPSYTNKAPLLTRLQWPLFLLQLRLRRAF